RPGHRPSRRCHRGSRPRDHQGGDGPTGDAHCDGLPSCDARPSWPRLGHHQLQGRDRLSVSDSPGEVNRGRWTQWPARRESEDSMIAAIYARKSTEQNGVGDEEKSVTRQIEHAKAYATKKGWTVHDDSVYVD